jgi:hypothetical protein
MMADTAEQQTKRESARRSESGELVPSRMIKNHQLPHSISMKIFTYYRPGCVESLRDLDHKCQLVRSYPAAVDSSQRPRDAPLSKVYGSGLDACSARGGRRLVS